MKKVINFLKSKYYVTFILHIVFFSSLAISLFYLDKSVQSSNFNQVFNFDHNFLKSLLIMMIGSIITIVTITFSTIMVVLTLYSGQFSPRTLNDFLQRKVPLNILAYFIGISSYSIIALVVSENHQTLTFSFLSIFALTLFLIGIVLFAYYIHYVSKSVQINIYIDKLVKEAVLDIEKYQKNIKDNKKISLEFSQKDEGKEFKQEYPSKQTGYFIDIDVKKLMPYLVKNNICIEVVKPFNEHIFEDDILFKFQSEKKTLKMDEEIIKECFIFGDEAVNFNEYLNRTMKLVEIAVRALSPGINDPATAKACVDQLGYIFMKLSDAHYSLYYKDDELIERLMIKTLNYDSLLYDHFYQIILYGSNDFKIVSSVLKALTRISSDSNYEMKKSLWKFALYTLKDINLKKLHEFDFREINFELKELAIKCGKTESYKELIA